MIDPDIFQKLDNVVEYAQREYDRSLRIKAHFAFKRIVEPWLIKHRLDFTVGNGTWITTSSVSNKIIYIEEIEKFKPMAELLNHTYGHHNVFGESCPDHRNDPHLGANTK